MALHVRLPGHEENFQRLGAGTEDGGEKDNAVEKKTVSFGSGVLLVGMKAHEWTSGKGKNGGLSPCMGEAVNSLSSCFYRRE
jgi:hypothetical protein